MKKKKNYGVREQAGKPRSDVTFTRGREEKEQWKVKVFLSFSFFFFIFSFFARVLISAREFVMRVME